MSETNRIDHDDPRANMFGILPCPKCGGTHRWPSQPSHPLHHDSIICDGCGFVEAIAAPVADQREEHPR